MRSSWGGSPHQSLQTQADMQSQDLSFSWLQVEVPYTKLKVFLVTNHIYIRVLLAHKCHWSCNCARHKTVLSPGLPEMTLLKHLQLPQKLCFFFHELRVNDPVFFIFLIFFSILPTSFLRFSSSFRSIIATCFWFPVGPRKLFIPAKLMSLIGTQHSTDLSYPTALMEKIAIVLKTNDIIISTTYWITYWGAVIWAHLWFQIAYLLKPFS